MSAAADIFITVIGWTGALSNVTAYALVTAKRITPDSLSFQGLNIFGAALLSVSASVYGAWPSAVVNVIWVAIGSYALYALWRRHVTKAATQGLAAMTIDGDTGWDSSATHVTESEVGAPRGGAEDHSAEDADLARTHGSLVPALV